MKPSVWCPLTTFVSIVALAACGGGAGTADAAGPTIDGGPPSGSFAASWMLNDDGTAVSCADVGATIVRYSFIPSFGNGIGFVGVFDCGPGSGTTTPHEVGTYSVDVQL
jgi:hypothetical protein